MKELVGLVLVFGGLAVVYGGTFATFVYGIYIMIDVGFFEGLVVSTLGAVIVFVIGILTAASGKVMVES